jgi:hypothetical protein
MTIRNPAQYKSAKQSVQFRAAHREISSIFAPRPNSVKEEEAKAKAGQSLRRRGMPESYAK